MITILVKSESRDRSIFSYVTDSYSIDEYNFIVFFDSKQKSKIRIPLSRVLEVRE